MNETTQEVRPADTIAERAARIREMHKGHIRTTLEQARDLGRELCEMKEQCIRENQPWLPALESVTSARPKARRRLV